MFRKLKMHKAEFLSRKGLDKHNIHLKETISFSRMTNVIFIVMDTARAKSFSFYGHDKKTTPNLEKFLKDSVLYKNAFANSPWTLPSHASFFTGLHVSRHGTNEINKKYSPKSETLPETLRKKGLRTTAISSNTWISKFFNFDRGFDEFHNTWQIFDTDADFTVINRLHADKPRQERMKILIKILFKNFFRNIVNASYEKLFYKRYDYGARRINNIAKKIIENNKKPFFLFINYLEPHLKYKPPKGFRRFLSIGYNQARKINQDAWKYIFKKEGMDDFDFKILNELYDCELNYLDYRIGKLLDYLKQKNLYDDSMIIITSDHGENIGEHELMDHQYCLYDTLLKIPLAIKYPKKFILKNKTEDDLVQAIDLYPTILDVLKIKKMPHLEGNSILKQIKTNETFAEYKGPQPSRKAILNQFGTVDFPFERALVSTRTREHKFIWSSDGKHELYNIKNDPDETKNIILRNKELAKRFIEKISEFKNKMHFGEREKIKEGLSNLKI